MAAGPRLRGVRGVPCFIIDNHYVVQGAQPSELWLKAFDEIAEKTSGAGE